MFVGKLNIMSTMLPTSLFILILLILSQSFQTDALVASAPGIPVESLVDTRTQGPARVTEAPPISLRVRSTNEQDLTEIASLLASANVDTDESQWNWKTSMEVLRNKSAYHNLLSSRYSAMQEGARLAKHVPLDNDLCSEDRIRLLWSHDSFRKKLDKAATMAKETHVWNDFVVCPRDTNMLRHKMITAEDATTGNVVGFCEVAMLAFPSSHQDSCESVAFAPTVANLVTSSKHRRQGIASSLLKSARNYVERQWSSDEIALYVDPSNKGAIALYSKHGFLESKGARDDADVLFMTKSLQTMTQQRETVVA